LRGAAGAGAESTGAVEMIIEVDMNGAVDGGSLTAGDGDGLVPAIDKAFR